MNLSRPFVMAATEPICIFWNLYIGLIYAILYLSFISYPMIFMDLRGWSLSFTGLSYSGIGIGSTIAIASEPLFRRLINSREKDPETGKPSPEAMATPVCIAAIISPIGQFWFAWTTPPVHWIWSLLAGIPFGAGATTTFIYGLSYLAHSYGIFAASAASGNTVVRCILGGFLPLAGPGMYLALGPNWSNSLLGFIQISLIPIPFIFWKKGKIIREKSLRIKSARGEEERLQNP